MHAVARAVFFSGQSFEDVYIEKGKDGDRKLFFLIRGGGSNFTFTGMTRTILTNRFVGEKIH